jgi:hypothetical protein
LDAVERDMHRDRKGVGRLRGVCRSRGTPLARRVPGASRGVRRKSIRPFTSVRRVQDVVTLPSNAAIQTKNAAGVAVNRGRAYRPTPQAVTPAASLLSTEPIAPWRPPPSLLRLTEQAPPVVESSLSQLVPSSGEISRSGCCCSTSRRSRRDSLLRDAGARPIPPPFEAGHRRVVPPTNATAGGLKPPPRPPCPR